MYTALRVGLCVVSIHMCSDKLVVLFACSHVVCVCICRYSAFISGIGSAVALAVASEDKYGKIRYSAFVSAHGNSPSTAALFQLAGVGLTIAMSIVTGLASGHIVKCFADHRCKGHHLFEDDAHFEIESQEGDYDAGGAGAGAGAATV